VAKKTAVRGISAWISQTGAGAISSVGFESARMKRGPPLLTSLLREIANALAETGNNVFNADQSDKGLVV
jgi:hypothetical protein